jgi:DNA-binding CsgD family transcriptional regulator
VTALDRAREAMAAELAEALTERDCARVEAAAVWLQSAGMPLLDVYELLLAAALQDGPAFASTSAEHLSAFGIQECVRDLVARLSTPHHPGTRGQVLVAVPDGSRWVLGTAALAHVLEDAGFSVAGSPWLGLGEIEAALSTLEDPVGLCLGLHDVSQVPAAREVVRRIKVSFPTVRVVVGGQAQESVADLRGLVGAHAATSTLRETLAALGEDPNPLSPREMAVLECVAKGMSNPDAGHHLGVASATVKTHLDRVYAKLGTSDRTATVALAMRKGWIL